LVDWTADYGNLVRIVNHLRVHYGVTLRNKSFLNAIAQSKLPGLTFEEYKLQPGEGKLDRFQQRLDVILGIMVVCLENYAMWATYPKKLQDAIDALNTPAVSEQV